MKVTFFDPTKLQSGFWPHRVWIPAAESAPSGRSVVYVTEWRRRVIGLVAIVVFVILGLTIWVAHAAPVLLVVLVLIGAAVTDCSLGGQSGFYEVANDGSLGTYLGKGKPDLHSMKGMGVPRS